METRTAIIGLCRQEAHANLQRHIRTGGLHLPNVRPRHHQATPRIAKNYTVHRTRPPTTMEILILAAAVAFLRVGR